MCSYKIHTHTLTWKLGICSLSSGLVTDRIPEMASMINRPLGFWSAPGPVTLYRSVLVLSLSDWICNKQGQTFYSAVQYNLMNESPFIFNACSRAIRCCSACTHFDELFWELFSRVLKHVDRWNDPVSFHTTRAAVAHDNHAVLRKHYLW